MTRESRLDALRDEAARLEQTTPTVRTYYDQPYLKPPVWTWEIPAYFFAGGVAGVAAMIAAVASFVGGDPRLVRDARWVAAAGALLSPLLLISDLGRPERFLNMLRVFKLRSPMSIGAWTLVLFAPAVMTPIALDLLVAEGGAARQFVVALADVVGALTGLLLATYTGVLIGATAIPVWAAHARILPLHFGVSSLGAAVSIIELCGHFTPAMNLLGIVAAMGATVIGTRLELRRLSPASAGGLGAVGLATRLGDVFSGPVPFILRLTSAGWLPGRLVASVSAVAGSILTRYGWMQAGRRSATESRAGS